MRLVDAEEAYKVLTDYYHHKTEIQHKALKEAIERVPTVDAAEVVRCKDCIHRMEDGMCEYKDHRVVVQDDDDFCSWGDRKNETD